MIKRIVLCLGIGVALSACDSPKRVFVTKTAYSGNIGGIAGADSLCNQAASSAGLGGKWGAWLSRSTADARDGLLDNGPWYELDRSTRVFANKSALSGAPDVYLREHEDGSRFDPSSGRLDVWTGSTPAGVVTADTCNDWTYGGDATSGSTGCDDDLSMWTTCTPNRLPCDQLAHLYCFEL